jgi:hypothetical protein
MTYEKCADSLVIEDGSARTSDADRPADPQPEAAVDHGATIINVTPTIVSILMPRSRCRIGQHNHRGMPLRRSSCGANRGPIRAAPAVHVGAIIFRLDRRSL